MIDNEERKNKFFYFGKRDMETHIEYLPTKTENESWECVTVFESTEQAEKEISLVDYNKMKGLIYWDLKTGKKEIFFNVPFLVFNHLFSDNFETEHQKPLKMVCFIVHQYKNIAFYSNLVLSVPLFFSESPKLNQLYLFCFEKYKKVVFLLDSLFSSFLQFHKEKKGKEFHKTLSSHSKSIKNFFFLIMKKTPLPHNSIHFLSTLEEDQLDWILKY